MSYIGHHAFAGDHRLLCKAGTEPFVHPVYSPSGDFLAFTTTSHSKIFVYEFSRQDTHCVVKAMNPGRRFCFEPGLNRIVYRHASMGDPNRSERLISTDLYLFDPTPRTRNTGNAYGPYLLADKLWYRTDTDQPLLDYDGQSRLQGLYFERDSGRFWVLNERGDTLSERNQSYRIEGGEYSPDGNYFAAVTFKPERRILLINLQDGKSIDLASGAHPAWSGDSRYLVYHTISVDGSPTGVRYADMLTREQGFVDIGTRQIVTDLAMNDDGTRLTYANRNGDLYEVDVVRYPEPR